MDRLTSWIARLVFVFLYLPIAALIVYSFNSSEVSYRFDGFTFRWYAELFRDQLLLDSLRTSALVGLIAALAATGIGFLTSFALVRFRVKGRAFFVGAILIPLIVPEIVLGVAMLTVFSTASIPTGLLTLVLGHIVITLPLATLVMMGAMSSLDPSLSEAATDLGASPWVTFRRVLFPLLRPSILAAFLLSFTTSFSNIVISTFTAGVGTTTLPLRIYSTLRTGLTPELNALGTLLVVATLGIILLVGVSQMRRILAGPRP
ncbi:ABC transporter permease [Herbiconiux sp. KACC 21604]|uniref:ABC transporter permease n=1 Tax=unclassified Herbiconiux TaxID=2618217 RepID=UPI001492735E|nr:ABC transporter permease [Herbiconiux sp. SALV-R1]QJU55340.1 ABC transporter permease [Herbiconiux sp. SALV-R1]WPO86510.1 ABC transporter permease [Herbiconiux sp. KACC 21604]